MSSYLLTLPHEVLHGILKEVDRHDLSAVCKTCHALNNFINGNTLLWKGMYLQDWDEPEDTESFDWIARLKEIARLEKTLGSQDEEMKESALDFINRAALSFLRSSPPGKRKNSKFLATFFDEPHPRENPTTAKQLLTKSSLYSDSHRMHNGLRRFSPPGSVGQLSAKLHCLYGVPVSEPPSPHRLLLSEIIKRKPTNWFARSRVYDIRNYTAATKWGPLLEDGSGRVDWERMEAIMIVLDYNMQLSGVRGGDIVSTDRDFLSVWTRPFEGIEPKGADEEDFDDEEEEEQEGGEMEDEWEDVYKNSAPPISKDIDLSLVNFDPYDVTGCWLRVVCFLDYSDFYALNFAEQIPAEQTRMPIRTQEAIRLITLTLNVSRIEPAAEKGALPIVYFEGLSKLVDTHWDVDANSRIKGSVRLTPEGEVRWQTISIFHGDEERWRSEGIQVGGLRSRRPILGTWFDKDYDDHGPLGPTAFWKIHDVSPQLKSPRS